jgi:osmoprotectant transport system permease protein
MTPTRRPAGVLALALVPVFVLVALATSLSGLASAAAPAHEIRVGSKRFTESYVLGEIVEQTLLRQGIAAVHKAGLGNTGILVAALESGDVDVYPEYTGTIVREILKRDPADASSAFTTPSTTSLDALNRALADRNLKVAIPFGFSNTYALAMRDDEAAKRGITKISDLSDAGKTGGLRLGLSNEFLARQDGWPAVAKTYGIALPTPSGLDHGLAYDALADRRVDLIDIYSTDARIGRDGVRVLVDDRHFFPAYEAVLLMRADVDPAPLAGLTGSIDNATMIALNARAELDHQPFAEVAKSFIDRRAGGSRSSASDAPRPSAAARFEAALFGPDFWRLLLQHVVLVGGSVLAAVIVGIPLGVWSARSAIAGRTILAVVSILQTVPSLALLALLIAVLGTIGTEPALVALFLYGLLPIVANTHAGLQGVARGIGQAATALGLTDRQRLVYVELPLAAPTIVTGMRTAAVINVGTATMAAFVGAGGFGERITAGLALNDAPTMLAGAVPAAVLALIVQAGFDGLAWLADPVRRHRR